MALFGVRVWNSNGSVQIGEAAMVGRLFGEAVMVKNVAGGVTDDRFLLGTPLLLVFPLDANQAVLFEPVLTVQGATVSWSWPTNTTDYPYADCLLMYGVY